MRTSLRSIVAAILISVLGSAAGAIEPVGSASRGTPEGESSRRSATATTTAPTSTAPAQTATAQNVSKTATVAPKAGPFGWQTSVDEALRLSRQHNMPVLVFVTSAHCPYCTKMKEQTFRTTSVIKEVDANFVPLKVERGSNPMLEKQLGIKSYPTTVVLRGDRVEVARMAGFIQAPQFLGNLKKIEAQWPVTTAARPTTRR